jgi:signal transduction histidine kinase
MFGRIRRLEISLAAKCQILFGAAVVLIIAAALLVPWQRMEQLTGQLDEQAAAALADDAMSRHIAAHSDPEPEAVAPDPDPDPEAAPRQPAPATQPGATTSPTTAPADTSADADDENDPAFARARLHTRGRFESWVNGQRKTTPSAAAPDASEPGAGDKNVTGAARGRGAANRAASARLLGLGTDRPLSKFDRRAFAQFSRHRELEAYSIYYERKDGSDGYRYARPLYFTRSCTRCHTLTGDGPLTQWVAAGATDAPASQPTTAPNRPQPDRLIGVVSVDAPSRINANELLLNRVFILAAGLLAATVAIVTFYVITTRLILQPVRVLQETAEKVSQGDLNIRSDISTGDEFQQLSETFNVMLANLKNSADQLRSINKSLDLKLGQLAESNLALYESNRLKSEFLANVSHELRTPLNSILGFADLLKDALADMLKPSIGPDGQPKMPDPKPGRYVHNILTSSRALLELINDLLDLAKIEAGRMEVRAEPLSLSDLFEGLVNILKPLSEQKRLTIETAVGRDVPVIHSDAAKLQQVLYNFLSNAIKFSPQGGRIDLAAALEGDAEHVRISVTDRGPGIATEKQQLIFEKFRQLDPSHTRTHGGTGLGLAISKELTMLLGGSIGVRSTAGEGATFWVVLPLKIVSGSMEMRGRLVLT